MKPQTRHALSLVLSECAAHERAKLETLTPRAPLSAWNATMAAAHAFDRAAEIVRGDRTRTTPAKRPARR